MPRTPLTPRDAAPSSLLASRRNGREPRWYVLVFPAVNYRDAERELAAERERHRRDGEPDFDFCAPRFVECRYEDGRFVHTRRPLFFNYVFVRASEQEIFRMKGGALRRFNFLPRVRQGDREYYPYLPDEAMRAVLWISRSFADAVPVCTDDLERLVRGDRVRIVEGRFKGVEARVARQPRTGRKVLVAYIENWMWIPLLEASDAKYEVIGLSEEGTFYSAYDYDRVLEGLHAALLRRHGAEGATADDRAAALDVIRRLETAKVDTPLLRCKQHALLLLAFTVLGDRAKQARLAEASASLLAGVKTEAGLALLLVTLYGCTDSSLHHGRAHELLAPYRAADRPKKSWRTLLAHLADYDRVLGH